MITEDYVSFETAKLLKENGFNEPTTKSYYTEGFENPMKFSHDLLPCIRPDEFLCPTLQMACKWLREIHSLHIQVFYDMEKSAFGTSIIPTMYPISDKIEQNTLSFDYKGITYEEACEEAIKYCLENLI